MTQIGKVEARRATDGSDELNRLRRGELSLEAYLDFRADESVRFLADWVPADTLGMIRAVNRALLANDPLLVAQVQRLTAPASEHGT